MRGTNGRQRTDSAREVILTCRVFVCRREHEPAIKSAHAVGNDMRGLTRIERTLAKSVQNLSAQLFPADLNAGGWIHFRDQNLRADLLEVVLDPSEIRDTETLPKPQYAMSKDEIHKLVPVEAGRAESNLLHNIRYSFSPEEHTPRYTQNQSSSKSSPSRTLRQNPSPARSPNALPFGNRLCYRDHRRCLCALRSFHSVRSALTASPTSTMW